MHVLKALLTRRLLPISSLVTTYLRVDIDLLRPLNELVSSILMNW